MSKIVPNAITIVLEWPRSLGLRSFLLNMYDLIWLTDYYKMLLTLQCRENKLVTPP